MALNVSTDRTWLTQRERQVLRLAAAGFSNHEIAREIGLTLESVKTHVRKALLVLGARSRTQAVAIALRSGEIS